VELDPQFAKAYAMLARTYQQSAMLEIGDVAQQKSQAADALDKALKLDPSIRDWWWVKAMFDDRMPHLGRSMRHISSRQSRQTRQIASPCCGSAHTYLLLARRDEALQMFERAFAADPLSPLATDYIAWWGYAITRRSSTPARSHRRDGAYVPNDPKVSWIRSNLAFTEGRALDWDRFVAR
jgi:tetratricopeptide (TPR) repeat protein